MPTARVTKLDAMSCMSHRILKFIDHGGEQTQGLDVFLNVIFFDFLYRENDSKKKILVRASEDNVY